MSTKAQLLQRMQALACAVAVAVLAALATPALAAEEQFLEPEKAFRFSARAADDKTVEVRFEITPGYYMYREQLRFEAVEASLQHLQGLLLRRRGHGPGRRVGDKARGTA